MGDS
jgi:hypothetical protein